MRSVSSPMAVSMMTGRLSSSTRKLRQRDQTVLARQHEIEHDQVDGPVVERRTHLAAVGGTRTR